MFARTQSRLVISPNEVFGDIMVLASPPPRPPVDPDDVNALTRKIFNESPSKFIGGRRSPAVACWASDHWVASSNPLGGGGGSFVINFASLSPGVCLAQFSLNNVHKRGLKHHHFISFKVYMKYFTIEI